MAKQKIKVSESDIQRTILDYLTVKKIFHYRNNSGAMLGSYTSKRSGKKKNWFMRFGALGSPDIVCVIGGQYIGIEVKGPEGKQSEHQKEFQENLKKAGGRYILARSLEDVIDVLG